MTRDEILAQAKPKGYVVARLQIDMVSDDWGIYSNGAHIGFDQIIAIEPPPETDAQKIARLEARIRELEVVCAILSNAVKSRE